MKVESKLIWITVKSETVFEEYELWNDFQKLMTLSIDKDENKIRVVSNDYRRDFNIENEGLLLNKTILKNEYGIKVGEISQELFTHNEGSIQLNEEHFHYSIHNNPLAELIIYRKSRKKPVLKCELKSEEGKSSINFSKNEESNSKTYHSLLIALCWFLLMPVGKENASEYALETHAHA